MVEQSLNLARKWRSKNFDQIIGQSMSVRMLKNSLYLNQFFPVYLFSGQHGCGKTSSARIFAAALNCVHLLDFQQKPREYTIPCGVCDSCNAMKTGRHPDFFEIDAASHTGVDTIRSVIESATLLPLMGRKKVYLIDEAHMLSKAAFNALLKILEEPPASVLFILATTDAQKIIETVRSRCFKLFFTPVHHSVLIEHLAYVCEQEKINYHPDGLALIADESGGSVRDALNIMEQVRFSSSMVSKDAVSRVLGRIDDATLIQILEHVMSGNTSLLVQTFHDKQFGAYAADMIWRRLTAIIRALVWQKYGVASYQDTQHSALLERLASHCSIPFLHRMMQTLYTNEQLFMRTAAKHELLEVILLQLCYKKRNNGSGSSGANSDALAPMLEELSAQTEEQNQDQHDDTDDSDEEESAGLHNGNGWQQFVTVLDTLNEPLLASIIKQGQFEQFDKTNKKVVIKFSQGGSFFNNVIEDTQKKWQPLLHDIFGQEVELLPRFEATRSAKTPAAPLVIDQATVSQSQPKVSDKTVAPSRVVPSYKQQRSTSFSRVKSLEPELDISDKATWQKTHMILRYFPGQVYEVRDVT